MLLVGWHSYLVPIFFWAIWFILYFLMCYDFVMVALFNNHFEMILFFSFVVFFLTSMKWSYYWASRVIYEYNILASCLQTIQFERVGEHGFQLILNISIVRIIMQPFASPNSHIQYFGLAPCVCNAHFPRVWWSDDLAFNWLDCAIPETSWALILILLKHCFINLRWVGLF